MPDPAPRTRHVFVYGTLRRGGRNDIARYAPPPQFVGPARVMATLYDLGSYPGASLGGSTPLHGEVYAIAPDVEQALDLLESVAPAGDGEYVKRFIEVDVGSQRLRCLVYEIDPARVVGRPVIASGDWFDRGSGVS